MRRTLVLLLVAAALIAAGCGGERSAGDGTSGITGVVYLGPQCPVEQENSPCPDVPTEAEVVVSAVDGSEEITRARTDAGGRFRIALEPGSYQVQPFPLQEEGIVFGKPTTVTVPEGAFAEVNLSLDTGIR